MLNTLSKKIGKREGLFGGIYWGGFDPSLQKQGIYSGGFVRGGGDLIRTLQQTHIFLKCYNSRTTRHAVTECKSV